MLNTTFHFFIKLNYARPHLHNLVHPAIFRRDQAADEEDDVTDKGVNATGNTKCEPSPRKDVVYNSNREADREDQHRHRREAYGGELACDASYTNQVDKRVGYAYQRVAAPLMSLSARRFDADERVERGNYEYDFA